MVGVEEGSVGVEDDGFESARERSEARQLQRGGGRDARQEQQHATSAGHLRGDRPERSATLTRGCPPLQAQLGTEGEEAENQQGSKRHPTQV